MEFAVGHARKVIRFQEIVRGLSLGLDFIYFRSRLVCRQFGGDIIQERLARTNRHFGIIIFVATPWWRVL